MNGTDDIIRLLPESVANQIAAGEVIQQASSVIKELVENSVDAGAENIEIVVKDAGKTLIQVIDDGKGMSVTDARMALERYATSKIRCADDLFALHTMGFRGEALPSIAGVSEMEIVTRRETDELGTKIVVRGSHVESQEPTMALKGTNIKVKNLFYNFVARRRFLKKDSVELSHIVHEFERLALVNNDVSFKFTSNGVLLYSLPRGPLKDRIGSLFGKTLGENLIPLSTETSLVSIDGFISLPSVARQRGQRQFLFVNGRNMRHRYFHKAIMSCYENLIAKNAQPHYFINFKVAPDRIDVNVHPQKHEIKFEDEQSIWQILTASVREALGRYNVSAAIDFNPTGVPEIPPFAQGPKDISGLGALTGGDISDYNPFELSSPQPDIQKRLDFGTGVKSAGLSHSRFSHRDNAPGEGRSVQGWEDFYKSLEKQRSQVTDAGVTDIDSNEDATIFSNEGTEEFSHLVQFRNKYILTEARDGILFIDQHRAHVNILFNELMSQARSDEVPSQALMFPEVLEINSQERIMLDSSIEIIERLGFRIGKDSSSSPTLEGAPDTLGSKNPGKILSNILSDLVEAGIDVEADAMKRIILTMARSAAITAGQQLSKSEMEYLVSSLFRLPSPGYTPDGLTVIFRLTDERIASFFQ